MHFSKELLKGAADVIVLSTLSKFGASYGYRLIELISHESGKIFELQEGTLYPLLYRLEHKGLVESYRKTAPSGKDRRYYEITKKGKLYLAGRVKEYGGFVSGMQSMLDLLSA